MKKLTFLLIFILLMFSSAHSKSNIKSPNVAGAFYSDNAAKLEQHISVLSESANVDSIDNVEVLISPHAGYIYSGGVAAHGFKSVANNNYKTIIIMGPSHFIGFEGVSIWQEGGFETPFGVAQIDEDFAKQLVSKSDQFHFSPQYYEKEHSLEVQIPFIQKTFKEAKIVPILMGNPNFQICEKLAISINEIMGDRNDVLVIVSTDFSHFHDDAFARKMDAATIEAVKDLQIENVWNKIGVKEMEMCGFTSVITSMMLAKLRGLEKGNDLTYANSGDVSGDKESVVGYSSIIFSKPSNGDSGNAVKPLDDAQKKRLIEIAKETVHAVVKTGKAPKFKEKDPRLQATEGAFVTLHKNGDLRGCIGHIIGYGPLYQTVSEVSVSSALHDTRFTPVTADELDNIEVEVSVLSIPWKITNVDEIEMGKHGVIISKGQFHRGVYLPQVATDTGWSKEQFLSSLAADKAGLPADAWKDPSTTIEIFTADVFAEHEFH